MSKYYSEELREAVRKSKSASQRYPMVLIFSADGQHIDCIPKQDYNNGFYNRSVYPYLWVIDYPLTLKEAVEIINETI